MDSIDNGNGSDSATPREEHSIGNGNGSDSATPREELSIGNGDGDGGDSAMPTEVPPLLISQSSISTGFFLPRPVDVSALKISTASTLENGVCKVCKRMHLQNFMSFINCLNAGDCCSRKCTCQGSLTKAESEAVILRFRQQDESALMRFTGSTFENSFCKVCKRIHFQNNTFNNCLNAGDCCSKKCTCQGSLTKAESEAIILRFRQQRNRKALAECWPVGVMILVKASQYLPDKVKAQGLCTFTGPRTNILFKTMGERIPETVLNSGEKIPMIGLGTASAPVPHDLLISSFITAIETGYRHFDTAALYGSEAPLGKAIAQALQQGLVRTREELFITSKLWCTDAHHDRVLPALKQTLQNLELDYIDLYLIHWPVSLKPGEMEFPCNKEDLLPMDFKAVWEAMEECQRLGLVKSIGVSNFSSKKLSQLMVNAKIPPAVNQVELNPAWQQRKLRDFCKENGIHVSAWSPLGAFGAPWGSPTVMESPILKEIAAAKGKSTAQVSLRWIYQQGVSVIVKSFNKERMKENLGIFDWELSEEELQQISQIPQHSGFSGELLISPTGPYKTLQELWDEDS